MKTIPNFATKALAMLMEVETCGFSNIGVPLQPRGIIFRDDLCH